MVDNLFANCFYWPELLLSFIHHHTFPLSWSGLCLLLLVLQRECAQHASSSCMCSYSDWETVFWTQCICDAKNQSPSAGLGKKKFPSITTCCLSWYHSPFWEILEAFQSLSADLTKCRGANRWSSHVLEGLAVTGLTWAGEPLSARAELDRGDRLGVSCQCELQAVVWLGWRRLEKIKKAIQIILSKSCGEIN